MKFHRSAARVRQACAAALIAMFAAACGSSSDTPVATATATRTRTVTPTASPQPTSTATRTPSPFESACGPGIGATCTATVKATATPTQTQGAAAVSGLLVVSRTISGGTGDALGTPPEAWSGKADTTSFNQSLGSADWSIAEAPDKHGTTAADGRFTISGLSPGRYTLLVSKTLDGNLLASPGQGVLLIPFSVGSDGSATVVAELSWGLVRSVSTYVDGGVQVREVHGPYGNWQITRNGQLSAFGDASRTLTDDNGDGAFDVQPCIEQVWNCSAGMDLDCGPDRVCSCTASCPFCKDCGAPVCVPPGGPPPYPCSADADCTQPGDQCVCVASCPSCDDCTQKVCVPGCVPLQVTGLTITSGPAQLVAGRQGQAYAAVSLSDGSQFDVTYLADWHSSDESVATVDSWGTVSALAVGSTNLTATLGALASPPFAVEVVERPTLQSILIQNQSCSCGPLPLGAPQADVSARPCIFNPPVRTDVLPIPSCQQVVQVGATLQFTAIGEFADGSYEDVTKDVVWQVSPSDVGDVANGLFTARTAGTGQLTASLGTVVSNPTEIRVVTEPTVVSLSIYADTPVVAIASGGPVAGGIALPCVAATDASALCCCQGPVDPSGPCGCGFSIAVLRGDQVAFHATAQYDTGEWRDVTVQATWRSSNTAAATIDASGALTAVDAGDTTIDAVFANVTSNPVGVHVVDQATLQSLSIDEEGTDRVVPKGEQRFFHATGFYDVGFARDVTTDATWHSSDNSIGGFDTPGIFTARTAGTVQLWAELDGQQSNQLSLEVFETSTLDYCDPGSINRAVWSDNYNRVILESDCAAYHEPDVVALRYTVTETQTHGGVFDPCLDLYVYQGKTPVRTIRQEGCGAPFLPTNAPSSDAEAVKYQLLAFWDLKDDNGQPVVPGTYTIYGRFYLYYDPVVSLDVIVVPPDQPLPTPAPTTPAPVCTPPLCRTGEVFFCPDQCPGGCGTECATPTPFASPAPPPSIEGACFKGPGECVGSGFPTSQERCCEVFRLSASLLPISWCSQDHLDPDGQCSACGNPCAGLPTLTPSPTPCDSGPPCPPGQTKRCDPTRTCGDAPACVCELVPTPPDATAKPTEPPPLPTLNQTPSADDFGLCYEQVDCEPLPYATKTSRAFCCDLARSSTGLPFSWCSATAIDPMTGLCTECVAHPCLGVPTPTPKS